MRMPSVALIVTPLATRKSPLLLSCAVALVLMFVLSTRWSLLVLPWLQPRSPVLLIPACAPSVTAVSVTPLRPTRLTVIVEVLPRLAPACVLMNRPSAPVCEDSTSEPNSSALLALPAPAALRRSAPASTFRLVAVLALASLI